MNKNILAIGIVILLIVSSLAPITVGNIFAKSNNRTTTQEELKQSLNPPLESSWPMYQHDAANTGYSQATFPNSFDQIWFKSYQNDLNINWISQFTSPVTSNGKIFIQGDVSKQQNWSGVICALNQNNGSLIWKKEIPAPVTLSFQSYKSPAIYDGKIFVTLNSFFTLKSISKIVALDENTGEILWEKTFLGTTAYSSVTVAEGKVFVGGHFTFIVPISWLYVFDINNGELLWQKTLIGYLEATPVVLDNKVFVPTGSLSGMLLTFPPKYTFPKFSGKSRIYAFNMDTGQKIWMRQVKGHLLQCSPTIANGKLFVPSNIIELNKWNCRLSALDVETGKEIWYHDMNQEKRAAWPSSISTPSVAYGKVFVTDSDGWLRAWNQETGDLIWDREIFPDYPNACSWCFASPVIIDEKVIVGANADTSIYNNELFMYNESNGELIWNIKIDGESSAPFIVSNEMLYVNEGENGIYAFG